MNVITADGGRIVADRTAAADPEVEATDDRLAVDIRAAWAAIYRNRLLVALIVLAALGIGVAITVLTTPIFQATATVQIDREATRVLGNAGAEGLDPVVSTDEDRFLQTQIEILRSRSLAERVAQSMGLLNDNRFLIAMGSDVEGNATMVPGNREARETAIVSLIRSNLSVTLGRSSSIAAINFTSPDPALAARVANSVAENFIVGNLRRKYEASAYARQFLQQQLADVKDRLEQSERASIEYARSSRLVDPSGGNAAPDSRGAASSLVTSNLVQLNNALAQATSARVAAEQRWLQAQATPLASLPEVQANATVQSLVRQRAELQSKYAEERARRTPEHPEMRQLQAQIDTVENQIQQLSTQTRNAIRDQFLVAQRQEQALRGNVTRLTDETLGEQGRGIRYNILRREVETNRILYDGLLQRFKELSAAAGVSANNISIVDTAEPPTSPILPRPLVNMALAGLGGLAIGLIFVLGREMLDDRIRSPDDVDRKLGQTFLGAIPRLPSGEAPMDALMDERSHMSEAYYALRSTLNFARADGLPKILLCTSSVPSEGKTTTSFAVAKSFARLGKKVLLMDADLRNPSVHRTLNLSSDVGLSSILTRQATVEQAVQVSEYPNLDVMPCGPMPPNPGELLGAARLHEVFDAVSARYDLVVIDGPPVMGLADAPILASETGGTLFVVEANRAHRGQAKIALRRLRSNQAVILGVVLTKFSAKAMGYGYDYAYSYAYNYSYNDKGSKKGGDGDGQGRSRFFKLPGR